MKHIGNELNTVLSARRIKKKVFAEKLGMTDVNLSKILKKKSVDAELLERISILLDMPIHFWFDEGVSLHSLELEAGDSYVPALSRKSQDPEVELLRALLAEKERTIQLLIKRVSTANPTLSDPEIFFKGGR